MPPLSRAFQPTLAILLVAPFGCGDRSAAEESAAARSAIINGTPLTGPEAAYYGLAAVYHPPTHGGPRWNPRPCSGVVVRSTEGLSWILTARHCFVTDAGEAGPADVKVLPGTAPGIANPDPPAAALPALAVKLMPPSHLAFPSSDMALVAVQADWPAFRYGMWVSTPSLLVNKTLRSFGYGINVADPNCEHPASVDGAGIARSGGPFSITFGSPAVVGEGGNYAYSNMRAEPPYQATTCGDSGGPDFADLGAVGAVRHLLGVHSKGSPEAESAATGTWVQSELNGVYLSSDATNTELAVTTDSVPMLTGAALPGAAVIYDTATQLLFTSPPIAANRLCLTEVAAGAVAMRACDGRAGQRWSISVDRTMTNVTSGRCLTGSGAKVTTTACVASGAAAMAQQWFFHAQPSVWTTYHYCASEPASCAFTGTRNVRFGTNGAYLYKTLSNGAACTRQTFGGDPVPNTPKFCYVGPASSTFCALEGQPCSFAGEKLVIYGANGRFFYRFFTNGVSCTNTAFGDDPIDGVPKACYLANWG